MKLTEQEKKELKFILKSSVEFLIAFTIAMVLVVLTILNLR